jgi:Flp pilus assembly protein TadD
LRPDFSRARNNLGTILVEEGRLSEAEREFRKAIKDDPFYIHALNNLAALVFSKGDLHEAKRLWERSIVLDPDQPDIKEALKKINEEIEMKRLKRP